MTEHWPCVLVVFAQLGIIYGLVNRLIKQSGLHQMNAKRAFDQMVEETIGSPTSTRMEKPAKIVKESYRIGV